MEIEFENNSSFEIEPNQSSNFILKINNSDLAKGPKGDTGPMGPQGVPGNPNAYMEYIDLSTDMEKPTDVLDYIDKSGIYVAKNKGIVGFDGEPFTVLAEGQFFEVQNLKDLAEILGEEFPDEDNVINISIPSIEGYTYYLQISNNEVNDSINITSSNINNYVNIDTSRFIDKYNNINSSYGTQIINNFLAIAPATQYEIDKGTAIYKPITAERIEYAVQTKGNKYFASKDDLKDVQDNINKLVTDIEAVLDTVVDVNE